MVFSLSFVVLAGCGSRSSAPPDPTPAAAPAPDVIAEVAPPTQVPGVVVASPRAPLAQALAVVPPDVRKTYQFSLSEDRSALTIDPARPAEARGARSGGFTTVDSANGGKVISLNGGPFANGAWHRAPLSELVPDGPNAEALRNAGYGMDEVRDVLVVDGVTDTHPTAFAFSADPSKPGIVGICSDVTVVDFDTPSQPLVVRKPVIYLYPEVAGWVEVALSLRGEVVAEYPDRIDDTWRVWATPEGDLTDPRTGRVHDYLFWEGIGADFVLDPTRAFTVAGDDTSAFLEEVCSRFALTDAECGDFVTYWLPEMQEHPYNRIQFLSEETYGAYASLQVRPVPDTVIRLFMVFAPTDRPATTPDPVIPQRHRVGFTVVEWGGMALSAR